MKFKTIIISTILGAGMLFTGCEEEELQAPTQTRAQETETLKKIRLNNKNATTVTITSNVSVNHLNTIGSWIANNGSTLNQYNVTFNAQNSFTSYNDDFPNRKAISVKQNNYVNTDQSNYTLIFLIDVNGQLLEEPMMLRSLDNVTDVELEYFTMGETLPFYSINFDKRPPAGGASAWGQRTADCMVDAYSNHGWVSVWATVQTAFIPQTAAAIGAACAIDNY